MATYEWYLGVGGKVLGPFSRENVQDELNSARVNDTTLVWHASLPNWQPITLHFQAEPRRGPPPLPDHAIPERVPTTPPPILAPPPLAADSGLARPSREVADVQGKKTATPAKPFAPWYATIVIGTLRIVRGLFGFVWVWQVIGLIPVSCYVSNPGAVTREMWITVLFKGTIMLIFWGFFVGLRALINKLHNRWYGKPHPGLRKNWSL